MALRLELQAPEQVAGIAIAGASLQDPEDSSCPEQGAVPLLVVDGEKDPIHPIDGGRVILFGLSYRGRMLSAFDTAQTFAKRLGVASAPQAIHIDPQKRGDPTSADGFLWPSAPSPVVALYKIKGGGHVVPQPVFRYPRIVGRTTTAVDMPKLMIEMFHISNK
jgi:polyhydroxybutyrate depolymerase